jgi:soluble lytic murein transglycosylase
MDERAAEWHARAAIWADDWKRTKKVIAAMPESLRKQTRWRYWLARSAEQLGERGIAQRQYTELLGDDNYYAALAAARLGQPYTPNQQPIPIDNAALAKIEQQPAFLRARELLTTGLRTDAYEEWRDGYTKLAVDARVQSIALASQWGWHDQAIQTAAQLGLFDDYGLLYPRPYDEAVNAASKATVLPPNLIYATLRQESIYRADAISVAGAQGLMQLLPTTARQTARQWRLPPPTDLLQPATNIPIGAAVLRNLHNSFGGQTPLALAAYNAGPSNAKRWLTSQPKAADVWIENIPFNETRTYVQRILWYSVVFGWLATSNSQDTSGWLQSFKKAS